ALAETMADNLYVWQYHIYTVALNQFLKVRLPGYRYDDHFGGVIYLFLRGIDPALGREFGVFTTKPREAIISELIERLLGVKQ
ncbi:MAG: hypothetical protein V3U73_09820, partial [bacterium]